MLIKLTNRRIGFWICLFALLSAEAAQKPLNDIPYGSRHERQVLDLYFPSSAHSPCLIFIHGGGWRNGDKKAVRDLPVEELLAEGYAVASINYEPASRTNQCWPRNLLDCKKAVRYLREHADEYGLDPERFMLAGASAGGHLALMTAFTWNDPAFEAEPFVAPAVPDPFRGVLAFFPVCDLTPVMKSFPAHHWGDPIMPESFEGNPALYRSGSPVNHVERDVPPTLVIHGTADQTVELELHSEVLVRKLKQLGADARLIPLEGAGHTMKFEKYQDQVDESILKFMSERTRFTFEKRRE